MRHPLLILLLCFAPASHAEGLLDRLPMLGGAKQEVILPPDQAFGVEVSALDGRTLIASFRVAPGYYLYRDKVSLKLADDPAKNAGIKIAKLSMPEGEIKHDPNFGDMAVFHQSIQAEITLERSGNAAQNITIEAGYQGCKDKSLCYPPTKKTFNIALPEAGAAPQKTAATAAAAQPAQAAGADSESAQIAKLFKQGNFWLIVSFFFGAGLLLALTPCVFPMIPILSGIIVGRGHNITHLHGFILSLAYVLGMAVTYSAVGVAAGLSGTLLSNALQTPWVLGSFAGVFVLLSLSMFGFYELQLPSALQSKLTDTSNKLHGGHLSGVFVMGALSAIIVGPCVAAPLAGALLYIGRTHDALLGGVALFALAMGMGLPLLLIGASAGTLLPKAGAWMESVKRFFGVLLLAVAIWLISPLIPVSVQMLLWAILLVLSAVYLHALDALPHNAGGWHKLWKGIGLLALLVGSAYLVGALSGARDVLRPLGALGSVQAEAPTHVQFERVKNLAELDARLARERGKTVMLDFYADWCVSCKEMERFTFSDPKVQARLKSAVLLQADVTANSDEDKALLQRFELFGPPAILFFDGKGAEQGDYRVTGYQNAEHFLNSLKSVGL
ncbi:MAG: thiol:disulfide interchange protein DsbD [Gallionellaceae bacterium]|nr:MAG: thiol:disulfide interchange protein DsbD [Gallionellaceae bacterium]